jgi:hypothetical protein
MTSTNAISPSYTFIMRFMSSSTTCDVCICLMGKDDPHMAKPFSCDPIPHKVVWGVAFLSIKA